MAMSADLPVGTVLVHPNYDPGAQNSPRLIKVDTTHPQEWPWRRFTGLCAYVPPQWSDLSDWQPQPLGDLGRVLGHAVVLTGLEVSR